MPVIPFVGGSYRSRSVNFASERSINLMLYKAESSEAKSQAMLIGRPGYNVFSTLPKGRSRGSRFVLGRAFAVYSNSLYEIFSDGSFVERGMLDTDTFFVSMADNGQQLCIVDGPNGYILDFATNSFTKIADPYFLGATTVTFIDGYFMFNKPNTGVYYISALYNGLTGDPLDFASAEGSPDNIVGLIALHKQVWIFGENTVQVADNNGDALFPFTTSTTGFIEYGCAAPYSIARTANTVFWLGGDEYGSNVIWMAAGYQPQKISTDSIAYLIRDFDVSDAIAYTYQEDGHYFYVLNFTNANTTIVYDVGANEWHERASFTDGVYGRHRPQNHMFAFDKHLVGDYVNGNMYVQSLEITKDADQIIRYERVSPHSSGEEERLFFSSFQLVLESGVGLITGETPETNPQVMLSWSNDGGHSFTSEYWRDIGKIGQYKQRLMWYRCGSARDRVWKCAITSANKMRIFKGIANVEQGTK